MPHESLERWCESTTKEAARVVAAFLRLLQSSGIIHPILEAESDRSIGAACGICFAAPCLRGLSGKALVF